MNDQAMTTRQDTQLAELSLNDLVAQVQKIQAVMKAVMKDGEHFGKIPGTDKPTLLKPGAEKLCHTFRFGPQYEVLESSVLRDDFINYRVRCVLYHIMTSLRVGSGMGSCNSRENKYRWRWIPTATRLPKEYWEHRDVEIMNQAIGTDGDYRPKKLGNAWFIAEQIENDNPAELDNTLFKMACKRALVAAVLNATAASDIFTQDLEEMPEAKPEAKPEPPTEKPKMITKGQFTELDKIIKDIKATDPTFDDQRFITEFCSLDKLKHLKAVNFDTIKGILDKRLEKAKTIAASVDDANVTAQQQQDTDT